MMTHIIKVTLSEEIEEVNFDPTASGRDDDYNNDNDNYNDNDDTLS